MKAETFARGVGVQKCKSRWCFWLWVLGDALFCWTFAPKTLFEWICVQKSATFVAGVRRKSLVGRNISDCRRAKVGDFCVFCAE